MHSSKPSLRHSSGPSRSYAKTKYLVINFSFLTEAGHSGLIFFASTAFKASRHACSKLGRPKQDITFWQAATLTSLSKSSSSTTAHSGSCGCKLPSTSECLTCLTPKSS